MSYVKGLLFILGIGFGATAVTASQPLWLLASVVSFVLVFTVKWERYEQTNIN